MKLSVKLGSLFVFLVLAGSPAFAQCTTPFASQPSPPSTDAVWIDDSLPSGATVPIGSVTWDTSQYATGTQSFVHNGAGTNTVRIDNLNQFLKFGTGKAVIYVLIDPCSTTREIKLTYRSAYRTAYVYWGENLISGGTKFRRGNLPTAGTWTRLEIPISSPLNMQGHTLEYIQIETYDGRVWFDHVGTDDVGCTPTTASTPSIPSTDDTWVDDDIPTGSYIGFGEWYTTQAANGLQSLAYPYFGQSVIGVVRINDLNQTTDSGDDLVLYVMPTGCATLNQLKITWYAGTSSGSVYWGSTGIGGESTSVFMGSTGPDGGHVDADRDPRIPDRPRRRNDHLDQSREQGESGLGRLHRTLVDLTVHRAVSGGPACGCRPSRSGGESESTRTAQAKRDLTRVGRRGRRPKSRLSRNRAACTSIRSAR